VKPGPVHGTDALFDPLHLRVTGLLYGTTSSVNLEQSSPLGVNEVICTSKAVGFLRHSVNFLFTHNITVTRVAEATESIVNKGPTAFAMFIQSFVGGK